MSTFEKIRNAALARLEAGEPAQIILQDYADFEEELRPVLEEATGKRISGFSNSKPKVKAQEDTSKSMMPMLLTAALVLLLFLGLGAAYLIPSSTSTSETAYVQLETTCVGIPQAQISSIYAQQNQNQQPIDNNSSSTRDGEYDDVDYDSAEEYDAEDGAIAPLPPVGAGGGSSTGAVVTGETTASSDDSFAISITPIPTLVPLPTFDGTPVLFSAPSDVAADEAGGLEVPIEESEVETRSESSGADYDVADDTASSVAIAPEVSRSNISTEPLRAGEIDDNAEWDDYQDYRNDFLDSTGTRGVHDVDTTGRQVIRVVDNDGNPVLNACVEIYNGESHITTTLTYATGLTLFFPNLNDNTRYVDTFRVVVSKGNAVTETILDREVVGGVTTIELDINQQNERVQLDVMFLLDATGSMGDEIAQLQGNILTISEQIDALPDNVDVRYGLVTYRDRGDQYVTRVYEFTSNVSEFQNNLLNVSAVGGGDYPESLNEGLDMALNAVEWRGGDTVRLMFLVADAPPHVDYQDDADYSLLMQDALARGIKIHQIASGGLEPEGEFVMRQIAQFTMGRFLFLTYEDGVVGTAGDERTDLEVGDPEAEQGIGDYSVSQLDELVLRLITDEIAALRGE